MNNFDNEDSEENEIISAETADIPPHPSQIYFSTNNDPRVLNRRNNYPATTQVSSDGIDIDDLIPILLVTGSILIIIGSFLVCWPVGLISLILFLWWKLR